MVEIFCGSSNLEFFANTIILLHILFCLMNLFDSPQSLHHRQIKIEIPNEYGTIVVMILFLFISIVALSVNLVLPPWSANPRFWKLNRKFELACEIASQMWIMAVILAISWIIKYPIRHFRSTEISYWRYVPRFPRFRRCQMIRYEKCQMLRSLDFHSQFHYVPA